MERHIVEILVILMREYPEGAIRPEEFEPLANNLIGLGYTQNEIESALFWFYNRQEVNRSTPTQAHGLKPGAVRMLHEVERSVITPKAYGYLIELNQLGLITLEEMDSIIERSVVMGGRKVDIDDMKMFIAAQILDRSNEAGFVAPGNFAKNPTETVH